MENQDIKKRCDGKCMTCNMNQQSYCTVQMLYYMQQEIAEIKAFLMDKDTDDINSIINMEKPQETPESGEILDNTQQA